ncbi:unnamed protein product [Rotaria socialis]|uniref:Uncharacterized protein n=1 Tax=Rotaria socialis TaxID=392032 RepID=A0A818CR44_9BILA|nr:unnamed protein product [Rotaria socialis]CAF4480548.1 unnamed protein product [Rotaria socialis]
MFLKISLTFLALIAVVFCQTDDEESFLFVTKQTLNRFIVQNKELTIKYDLYNSGPTTVFNVNLNDVRSFPADKFELFVGVLNPKWERILPGANVTHVVILKPKESGFNNSSHAIITYQKSEKNAVIQKTYSSEFGNVYIMTNREYDRRFSSHIIDWILFTAMASPCIAFPFFLWFKSKHKYELLLAKDKRSEKLWMGSALFFAIFSLVCDLIGFSTPYWLQAWPRVGDTTFRKLGLWQVCIAGFRNPKHYWGKVYYGCWWLYAREYRGLREDGILTPPWFTAVQTFACFGLIFSILSCIALIVVAITRYRLSRRSILIGCILAACAWFCNLLAVLIFGIYADAIPGKWMPRADYTFLSWSYHFIVASMVSSFLAVSFALCEIYFITEDKKNNRERTFIRHVGNPNQPFVRHVEKDEPPFVRKTSNGDQPFIRKNDNESENAFIRKADNDNERAFIRRTDGEEAFIRRADTEEAFIRRSNDNKNQGNNYIV